MVFRRAKDGALHAEHIIDKKIIEIDMGDLRVFARARKLMSIEELVKQYAAG